MANVTENGIDWYKNDKKLTVLVSHGQWKRQLDKWIAEGCDEIEVKHINNDGSYLAEIPADWVRITKPRTMNLSDEQRAALSERMSSLRKDGKL